MKRGILSILAALALCLTLLPATALAAESSGTCGDNLTWTLSEDGTLTISYTGEGSGDMTNFTSGISVPWFNSRQSIKKVDIQGGVTSIGNFAFNSSSLIETVSIPNSVRSIGQSAFYSCSALTSVKIPEGVKTIEMSTFARCSALSSVTIPSTVTTIGDNAFDGCKALESVEIPNGVTSIGWSAFCDCTALTKVEIPATVETIGWGAFKDSPNAEIHYEGTLAKWNSISGGNSGASQDKIATDGDATGNVTVDGSLFKSGVREGETVTVSAGTMDGKAFAGWTVTGLNETGLDLTSPSLTFTMPANDVTLTASWAEAVVIASGVYFADLQAAFDYAANDEYSHAVTLLKNVTVTEPITLSKGTITLTSREKNTLTGNGRQVLEVSGGKLTLDDVTVASPSGWGISAKSGTPDITIRDSAAVSGAKGGINQWGGALTVWGKAEGTSNSSTGILTMNTTLTVEEGAVISGGAGSSVGIQQAGGTLTIKGGTISGHLGLSVCASNTAPAETDATVHLTGGKFIGSGADSSAIGATGVLTNPSDLLPPPRALSTLLDPGYTIYKEDGTALTAEELEKNRTGPGTFTVGCAHASVESVTSSAPDENGVVTVTATCQRCKETVTLGTLTMVNDGQEITYGEDFKPISVIAEGVRPDGYAWYFEGSPVGTDPSYTLDASATALGYAGTRNVSCNVYYPEIGDPVTVTFSLTLKPADIKNAEITLVEGTATTVPYNGTEYSITDAAVEVTVNGKPVPQSNYHVKLGDGTSQINAGTYPIKVQADNETNYRLLTGETEVGTFTITPATPTIGWGDDGDNVEELREFTGKPIVPSVKPTVTVAGMDSYGGEAVTYSYAVEAAGPYTPGLPTDAGTYYVKAAVPQQKNYTAAETGTLTLVIGKAETKITVEPKAASLTYNGAAQALVTAAEASVGEVQYALSADGTWSKEIPTATVPGTYEVYYKVPETANYTGVAVQGPVNVEIKKAEVVAASQNLLVKNKLAKTYTLDLKPFLPVLPQGQTYGKLIYELTETDIRTEGYIVAGTVKLNGTVLTVPVNAVEDSKVGAVADITLTIKSDNFKDIQQIVTVSSTNKTPVTITGVTAAGWTYDGKVHDGYTGTPDTGEYTGELEALYGTWPFTDWLDGAPKDAGTYQVHLSIPEDGTEYEGEIILFFTVEPAQVTIKADDKTANVGDPEPELTYQVSGRAEGEALKTEPKLTCTPDMNAEGTYPIEISGAAVPDGGNYKAEIVYQPGTLTVSEKPAPPKPVDPTPPVDPDDLEVKLEVKEGFTEVPPALRALEHLNTPEKLTQVMRTAVTRTGVPAGNTAVYDVKLMVSADGGRTWTPATASNFPSGGLTVTLPYPAGTDSGYTFTVVHMFTTTAFGKTPGDTESPAVTNTAQGLQFTVTGLSPISVGWKEKTTGGSSSGGGGSSGGSYSGGGGSRPMASVTVEETEHGKVTSDRSSAGSGSPVTLTVQPDKGYRLESLTVADSRGNKLRLTAQGGGKYAFTMSAGAVTVKAVFAPLAEDADCPSRAFADLESGAWYHEAVDFVLRNGLMNGYGDHSFKPDRTLTRAQFAQILYNKEGRPAAAGGAPFTDVPDGAWCAPAIAWAAERGIAGGYGGGLFGPDDAITREQLAVMLWRYAGSPAAPSGELAFVDAERIGAHAREALRWAVRTGVMNGKAGGVLDPKGLATRAQTAQMLKNFLENG